MGPLNIIRRMHLRQKLSVREIARRTGPPSLPATNAVAFRYTETSLGYRTSAMPVAEVDEASWRVEEARKGCRRFIRPHIL